MSGIEWDIRTNAESGNDEGSTGAPGCRICGAPITGKMRIFCSKKCAQKAKLVGKKEVPSPIYTERACMDCGKVMMLHIRSKRCPECQLAANRQQSVAGKRRSALGLTRPLGSVDRCVRCGEEYIVTGPLQKYCASCAEIGAKEATRINRREKMREKLKDVEWCAERNARRCAQRKERRAKIEVDGRKVPRTSSGQSKIARRRMALRLTQAQLAEKAEMKTHHIGEIERGERKPKIDTLKRIAAALGCDVEELMEGEEENMNVRKAPRETGNTSRIARKRMAAGMTQAQLAERSGMQARYIGAIERGERNPKYDTLRRIATALGCGVEELME